MKVPSNMIIVGSVVTHRGLRGVVRAVNGDLRVVYFPSDCEDRWICVDDLEWSDAEPNKKDSAVDKILTSLECAAMWLEGGCNPLHAAEELRLNIAAVKKLRSES